MTRALFKMQFKSLISSMAFARRRQGQNVGGTAGIVTYFLVMALIGACVYFGIRMSFAMNASMLLLTEYAWLYFALSAIIASVIAFIVNVFLADHLIFRPKDNDILLPLPIPPGKIVFTRMLILALRAVFFSAIGFVPAIELYTRMMGFDLKVFLLQILMLLTISIFSISICLVVGFITAKVASRFSAGNGKTMVTVVLSFALMAVYMFAVSKMEDMINYLITNGSVIGDAVMHWLYPFYLIGTGCLGNISSLLIILLITIGIFALIYYLVQRNFFSIATATGHAKKKVYTGKPMGVKTVSSALLGKEAKRLMSSATYILNACMGAVMLVIFGVVLLVKSDSVLVLLTKLPPAYVGFITVGICLAICFMSATCAISSPSVSLEGGCLWVLHSLPVKGSSVLMAKLKLHVFVLLIPNIFVCCVAAYVFVLSLPEVILLIVCVVLSIIFGGSIGIVENLRRPRFDWKNETVVIKQSASVGFTMLISFAVLVAVFLPYFLIFGNFVPAPLYLLIAAVVYGLLDALLIRYLLTKGGRKFEEL